ncbi:hypothetical protein MD484_g2121, partial [Candolleomyces efflorescens]
MLTAAVFLFCCYGLGLGVPIPTTFNPHLDLLEARDEIRLVTNYRSTTEIIWTCLSTTLFCTWVSEHPDIVGWKSTRWQRFLARSKRFLLAFVAPEQALLRALKQWMRAKHIANTMNERIPKAPATNAEPSATLWQRFLRKMRIVQQKEDIRRWKTVHGHFLLMGGVIFSVDGQLRYIELQELIRKGNGKETDGEGVKGIEGDSDNSGDNAPNADELELYAAAREALKSLPTRDMEISDRSKGDAITKGLTLLQTTWFIVQLAARRAEGLNVTALEILTLAYAVINLFVYIFWWSKPFNVQHPIVINLTLLMNQTNS